MASHHVFQRSMSTEELVMWLCKKGLHPDDCFKLEEERFTGDSFVCLEPDCLRELGIRYGGRRLLTKLLKEVKCDPVCDPQLTQADSTQAEMVNITVGDDAISNGSDEEETNLCLPLCMVLEDSSDEEGPQGDTDTQPDGAAGAWIQTKKIWGSRTELKVHFINPSMLEGWMCGKTAITTTTIIAWAAVWHNPLCEKVPMFVEEDSERNADIRVEFTESGGCWSMVGTDAQTVNKPKPTMSLNLKGHIPNFQRSLVIHEFGHALGLEHEHQRSDFWSVLDKHIDVNKMRADDRLRGHKSKMSQATYKKDWSRKKRGGDMSAYDPHSIMHYWFDVSWLKNPKYMSVSSIDKDKDLSDREKRFLKGIHERHNSFATTPSRMDVTFLQDAYAPSHSSGPVKILTSSFDDSTTAEPQPPVKAKTPCAKKQDKFFKRTEFEGLREEHILALVDDEDVLCEDGDMNVVMGYLGNVEKDWEIVCQNLHIEAGKIEEIKSRCGSDPSKCLQEAIVEWLSLKCRHEEYGKPTWKKVAESVIRINKKLFYDIAYEHTRKGISVVPDHAKLRLAFTGRQLSISSPQCIVLDVNKHLHHVRNALLDAANQWNDIGLALDIRVGILKSIRGEDKQCLLEMLEKWMHRGNATMKQLFEALENESVDRRDIVVKIRSLEGQKRRNVGLPL